MVLSQRILIRILREAKEHSNLGMTGQVKEDILSRFGELGVFVEDKGKLQCSILSLIEKRRVFDGGCGPLVIYRP